MISIIRIISSSLFKTISIISIFGSITNIIRVFNHGSFSIMQKYTNTLWKTPDIYFKTAEDLGQCT